MKKLFLIPALLLTLSLRMNADVVEPGQMTVQLRVNNTEAFPSWEFFILYQEYYYDHGHQPGGIDTIWVADKDMYSAGDQGSVSRLYARNKKDHSEIVMTEASFGGEEFGVDEAVFSLCDEITVSRIKNGVIYADVVRQQYYSDGSSEPVNQDFFGGIHGGPFTIFGINGLLVVIPLTALLLLFLLFRWRKRISVMAAQANAG